jgi:hypothetical protein
MKTQGLRLAVVVAVSVMTPSCQRRQECTTEVIQSAVSPSGKYTAMVEQEYCRHPDDVKLRVGVHFEPDGSGAHGGPLLVGRLPSRTSKTEVHTAAAVVKWIEPEALLVRYDPTLQPSLWLEARGTLSIRYQAMSAAR